jgi:formylglycine-generating enzyme
MAVPRRALRVALVAVALGLGSACAAVVGIDSLEIGACRGGACPEEEGGIVLDEDAPSPFDGSGEDVDVQLPDTGVPCPGTAGPSMVRVGEDGNTFCIDSTEVTFGQYREFLAAKGTDTSGQPAECTWNTSYQPSLGGGDDIPAAGVDWCDALAYCRWAGKNLCGKQVAGERTGPVTLADIGDFEAHQWLLACSARGQLRYPYGGIHRPTACNTAENDAGKTLPVGTKPECQGGYPGVYDMIGNLWEWYDGPCFPSDAGALPDGGAGGPERHECFVKGGSFLNSGAALDCAVEARGALRERKSQDVGIRCCSP